MVRKLKIDNELRSLLSPLNNEERELLKKQIEEDGCLDAIKVWKGEDIIVDGYHRYEICQELGLDFDVTELEFEDKAAIAEWMITFQKGRRNATAASISASRGMIYNLRKSKPGGYKAPQSSETNYQVDNLTSTASQVASETGSSPATVVRDGKFHEALSKVADKPRDIILAGEVKKPTQKALERLGGHDATTQLAIVDSVKSGAFKTIQAAISAKDKPAASPPKEKAKLSPEDQAKANRKLAKDYIAKAVNAVDDYHASNPNRGQRNDVVKLLQKAGDNLW